MMRKQYTTVFKANVVLELLKDEKTLTQIAAEYEVDAIGLCCKKLEEDKMGKEKF